MKTRFLLSFCFVMISLFFFLGSSRAVAPPGYIRSDSGETKVSDSGSQHSQGDIPLEQIENTHPPKKHSGVIIVVPEENKGNKVKGGEENILIIHEDEAAGS